MIGQCLSGTYLRLEFKPFETCRNTYTRKFYALNFILVRSNFIENLFSCFKHEKEK